MKKVHPPTTGHTHSSKRSGTSTNALPPKGSPRRRKAALGGAAGPIDNWQTYRAVLEYLAKIPDPLSQSLDLEGVEAAAKPLMRAIVGNCAFLAICKRTELTQTERAELAYEATELVRAALEAAYDGF